MRHRVSYRMRARLLTVGLGLALVLTGSRPLLAKDQLQTREYLQPAYSGISIQVPADVEIRPSSRDFVTVTAEPKVLAALKLSVRSGVLTIDSTSFQTVLPIKILVEGTQIKSLTARTSGTITVRNLSTERFVLVSDSSADISLLGLNCDFLKLDISGSESIKISGKAKSFELKSDGSSEIDASTLAAQIVVATVSGASTAQVNAITDLRAVASDSASIKYRGSGRIKKQVSDAADIAKAN